MRAMEERILNKVRVISDDIRIEQHMVNEKNNAI